MEHAQVVSVQWGLIRSWVRMQYMCILHDCIPPPLHNYNVFWNTTKSTFSDLLRPNWYETLDQIKRWRNDLLRTDTNAVQVGLGGATKNCYNVKLLLNHAVNTFEKWNDSHRHENARTRTGSSTYHMNLKILKTWYTVSAKSIKEIRILFEIFWASQILLIVIFKAT